MLKSSMQHANAADPLRATHQDIWELVQRGLVYPSPDAIFVTFFAAGKPITLPLLRHLMADLRKMIHQQFGSAHTSATLGVGFARWRQLIQSTHHTEPLGMKWALPDAKDPNQSTVFTRPGSVFKDSAGDLWFHIKSDQAAHCQGVLAWLQQRLEVEEGCVDPARTVYQAAATRSNSPDRRGGKVLGSRFSETLNNATDPLSIQTHTIVGLEDPEHVGASYVLAQRFTINWEQILAMSPGHIEDMVGRTTHDTLVPSHDDRSHIKRARAQDAHGNTTPILRLGLPFGHSQAVKRYDLLEKGATRRDEEGIYFAGYAKSAEALERIMDRQLGDVPGAIADRLLAHVTSDIGGLYYVPSLKDLGLAHEQIGDPSDWTRFPGVDWSRLDRHFDQASANGLLHYNHKEYLYAMTTMRHQDRKRLHPPSHRVLLLLANTFSRWQDNWYFDRAQPEMPHLRDIVAKVFGEEKAKEVMELPVVERSGWATRMMLGYLLVSDDYGYRGRRPDKNGNMVNGADTYRIHPAEILVGSTPNLGLGQGKYLMEFAREDEQLSNFFDNLSYASGVGHVVPQFKWVMTRGLKALTQELYQRRDQATDSKKRSFYQGSALALEGIREHCMAYAHLAGRMAADLGPGQQTERVNLLEIQARMTRISEEAPQSFVEAAQLLLTLHACLHHAGEPTAVGRLDQLLQPFYAADVAAGRLHWERAQEIIDCFWIKLGEKVQLNRQFVEDHQVFGNLAMGGSSGNYPQGSSLNQWIQQVTVGGTVADESPGEGLPAYNDVTLLCLRAARRLPLNAPCLSLRIRSDISDELLHEAALAILSGGAHPILTSDAKIIPGLQKSGDNIGARPGGPSVAEQANGLWKSEVSLRDARDYAADGCYEPQLAGTSWFTLGGLTSTQALEAALNQGKLWQSAGPVWFRGQKVSFTSEPAKQITSFEQLMELYFKHLKWMYAKQVDGQLGLFGKMNAVCPAPLLSLFIDDCIEKGLDYYEGGPRYNVIAPCFTGISTLIDSLWAIRAMVFDPKTAVTSLPELVEALWCNWGEKMVEPFVSTLEGPARIEARAERFRQLRAVAMSFPKFGRGHAEVDAFADPIIGRIAQTAVEVFTDPAPRTAATMVAHAKRLGTPEKPFGGFQIQPGVGSFENYLDWGNMSGASADGRLSGDPLASDLSAAPSYGDLPIEPREAPLLAAMAGYAGPGVEALWDGAPTDFNIREDFPIEALQRALRAFAEGKGSSIMTLTCANPETFAQATQDPEKYDLLRVRMGGWSEFFVVMFPAHQAQHQRRPLSTPTRKNHV